MTAQFSNPFQYGINACVNSVKSGHRSAEQIVNYCLQRIQKYDQHLQAFEYVAAVQALASARELDAKISRGENAGPLAGLPIGVKDIYSVADMPTTNGSLHPCDYLNGAEGQVIQQLKKAGCIVLGKTRTVEYALGATGINAARGTPVNVWDAAVHRIPGGSSSGSGVAVAAGFCAFALGSDTGGSVRNPACFNGLVGHKTSVGRWPTDGIFPLSSTFDSAGPLCLCVADAALIHSVITGESVPAAPAPGSLRLGVPKAYFLEQIDDEVRHTFESALTALRQAGVELLELQLNEAQERDSLFPDIVPPELIAQLGPDQFKRNRSDMDNITAMRASRGLDVSAVQYLQAKQRHLQLCAIAEDNIAGLHGWLSPTCPFLPMAVAEIESGELAARSLLASRNTMPVNIFGQTAITLPIHQLGADLPVGLQLVAAANQDAKLLSMAQSCEQILGRGAQPDITGFEREPA